MDDELLIECMDRGHHFLKVYRTDWEDGEPNYEITTSLQPHGLGARIRYAFNALFRPTHSCWDSQWVMLDEDSAAKLRDFIAPKYGYTKSGQPITEELTQRLAAEAEKGYGLSRTNPDSP